ncbi:hypothetical protein [Methylomonas sp. LL1]|uniref:hypothetical protein n=1 Tax=Methylomonas sp. LL1 TaxID=2785785 RepID=UPI001E28FCBE|nr:hypothetical protein [Methylomonas sp. LL1]
MFLVFPTGKSGKNRVLNAYRRNVAAITGALKMPVLSTVNQFTDKHQAFTKGGLRALIFNENSNGLAKAGAVVRLGRKVLIDEAKFFAWVESQNAGAA